MPLLPKPKQTKLPEIECVQVTQYRTPDGMLFEDADVARRHSLVKAIETMFDDFGSVPMAYTNDAAEMVVTLRDKLVPLLLALDA